MKKILKLILTLLVISPLFASDDIKKWTVPNEVPTPQDNKITKKRVELGKYLYFDKRLSSSKEVSCATCHDPKLGWSDGKQKAVGVHGKVGSRNSPTIINTAFQTHQFWDGRSKSLEDQALGPMQADVEMDMKLEEIEAFVKANKGYVKLFKEAYPNEKLSIKTVAKAIATFERTVISPESPFDRFMKGDKSAISSEAKKGWDLFQNKAACTTCHDGFNFTDGSFHNIGLGDDDIGRQVLKMKRLAWKGAMKTPTLRDVEKTAPYFHDGSVYTLEEAIAICAKGGRKPDTQNKSPDMKDRGLNKAELSQVHEFLKTLSGADIEVRVPTKFPQ